MRINELRKLVQETVQNERKKESSKRRSKNKRNWNALVENAVKSVLLEGDEEPGPAPAEDSESSSGSSGKDLNSIVDNALKLGQVDVPKAKGLVQIQDANPEDAIKVGTLDTPCKNLKPTQSSMNVGKAMHFALGMINGTMYGSGGPGGNLGAFTCDNYLLDGHHRWIATCMVAPNENVQGYDMQGVDAVSAVKVLNVATAAFQGHNEGKQGQGSFKPFRDYNAMLEALKSKDAGDVTQDSDGNPLEKPQTSVPGMPGEGNATKVCEEWAAGSAPSASKLSPKMWEASEKFPELPTGEKALEWAAQTIVDNCSSIDGVSDGAVLIKSNSRVDMPVADDPTHGSGKHGREPGFDKKDTATQALVNALDSGGLDVFEESINLERWNKLAGILKD
tara:strand:+ start:304 stop:1479 length:1176 start_codon:yes stop_codon:yes gene_type:complete